jgi:hypothetical protein
MSDETATPETPSRADVRLVGRAVKSRWPIPDSERKGIVDVLIATVAEGQSERTQVAAAQVLMNMDKLNLEQERRDQKIPDYHEHALSGTLEVALAKVYGEGRA